MVIKIMEEDDDCFLHSSHASWQWAAPIAGVCRLLRHFDYALSAPLRSAHRFQALISYCLALLLSYFSIPLTHPGNGLHPLPVYVGYFDTSTTRSVHRSAQHIAFRPCFLTVLLSYFLTFPSLSRILAMGCTHCRCMPACQA
jgi:hypothetical protein